MCVCVWHKCVTFWRHFTLIVQACHVISSSNCIKETWNGLYYGFFNESCLWRTFPFTCHQSLFCVFTGNSGQNQLKLREEKTCLSSITGFLSSAKLLPLVWFAHPFFIVYWCCLVLMWTRYITTLARPDEFRRQNEDIKNRLVPPALRVQIVGGGEGRKKSDGGVIWPVSLPSGVGGSVLNELPGPCISPSWCNLFYWRGRDGCCPLPAAAQR